MTEDKKTKPHRMNWPAVIKHLRTEASRDIDRAQDAIRLRGDKAGAMQLSQSAVISFRLASAFAAGLDPAAAIETTVIDPSRMASDPTMKKPKGKGRPPGIVETKPRAPRKKKEPVTDGAR